jgi:hypothetical protein
MRGTLEFGAWNLEASTGIATISLSHWKAEIIECEVELCVALRVTLMLSELCFCQPPGVVPS